MGEGYFHLEVGHTSVSSSSSAAPRYDYEAVRLVRCFRGHTDRITDMALASDARWLLSSSLDGTVRVWDVPAANCLQVP